MNSDVASVHRRSQATGGLDLVPFTSHRSSRSTRFVQVTLRVECAAIEVGSAISTFGRQTDLSHAIEMTASDGSILQLRQVAQSG